MRYGTGTLVRRQGRQRLAEKLTGLTTDIGTAQSNGARVNRKWAEG